MLSYSGLIKYFHLAKDIIHFLLTSAGVPTNAPHAPAVIPSAAFMKKPGGFPSVENVSNSHV